MWYARLLCRLGLHSWRHNGPPLSRRACRRCGRRQVFVAVEPVSGLEGGGYWRDAYPTARPISPDRSGRNELPPGPPPAPNR